MATGVLIRKATADDVPALTEVLAEAFEAAPVLNFFVRQDAGRRPAARRYFEMVLRRLTLPHGEVYTTVDRDAVACWTPPERWDPSLRGQLALLPDYLRICGAGRFPGVARAFAPLLARHPRRPHFYLPFLGVLPSRQGRGLGSALLRPVLERCDELGLPAYLENSNPRNRPLYERHCFEVTGEIRLGREGPPLWPMWREPAA